MSPRFPPPCLERPARAPHARIVLVYDTFTSAVRGKGFCDQLAKKLEVHSDLEESLWRSDLLGSAEIRQEAARAALNADFVVISVRGDTDVCEGFERWFAKWMPFARDRDITLVLLFDAAVAARVPMENIRSYMRKAAFAAGIHFFAHTVVPDGNNALPVNGFPAANEPAFDAGALASSVVDSARFPRGSIATILVVDDNPSICEMVARHLHPAGYGVVTAHDGEAAQRIVEAGEHPIDLVITDIEMPRLRGDELAVWLQHEHPEVRVLVMSSFATKAAGIRDLPFIAKPFRLEELVAKVGEILEVSSAREGC